MQYDKKQLEILLIHYFSECYADFPKGKIVSSESPDFMIKMKNRHLLGIELTRLNPGNSTPPETEFLKEIESREQLIEMVRNIFERDFQHKLFVKFLFSEANYIKSESQIVVAVQTAGIIRRIVQHKKTNSTFRISISSDQLPEGIDEILIVGNPVLEVSIWERSNNLGVSNNVVDDIKNAIHKKDEKLRLYQKQRLNYYWLLITTDRLRGVKNFNLPNKIMNHTFHSDFQHVFLFDLIKSEVFVLV
jgi:hypothetical protein